MKGTTVEEVKDVSHDTSDKKKAEDLWSTFKADVAMPIKRFIYSSSVRNLKFASFKGAGGPRPEEGQNRVCVVFDRGESQLPDHTFS